MQEECIAEAIGKCCERFVGDMESNIVKFLKQKMSVCFCQAASALGYLHHGDIEQAKQALGLMFVMHGMQIPGRDEAGKVVSGG